MMMADLGPKDEAAADLRSAFRLSDHGMSRQVARLAVLEPSQ
jgi:hypothetical protein